MGPGTERTIIQSIENYEDYPFERISPSALTLLEKTKSLVAPNFQRIAPLVFRALECFLQVTNQRLTASDFTRERMGILCQTFLGALNSSSFIRLRPLRRYTYSRTFLKLLLTQKSLLLKSAQREIPLSYCGPTAEVRECIDKFLSLKLDDEKVWLWRGWVSQNRVGLRCSFPLYPVFRRLGRDFTQLLFQCCDDYFAARKASRIACVPRLAQFIGSHPGKLRVDNFQDPLFMTGFWRDFFTYYFKSGYENGIQIPSLVATWRNQFLFLITDYLIPSGWCVESFGGLPSPDSKIVSGSRSHLKTRAGGIEVTSKLLTDIPLNVSDDIAKKLLFEKIQADFNLIVAWAEREVSQTWKRYKRRIELAPLGTVRIVLNPGVNTQQRWLTDRRNPDYLKHAAATFQHYGFQTGEDAGLLYPTSTKLVARELAIPAKGELIPHCALLIAEHPAITPAFLGRLELFDKGGKRVGFVETDSGFNLIGYKDRRGAERAQQIVDLNSRTAEVVTQIITITQPLRDFLRSKDDDSWRYLLLSSGKGFGYPKTMFKLSECDSTYRKERLAVQLAAISAMSGPDRLRFAQRFNFSALRASAGVLTYIKTGSVTEMAKALGHAAYTPRLLSRYLPEPILSFFQERWIRIFQTAIIVEALKESDCLLSASGFSTIEELDDFLKNHALKRIPGHLENPENERAPNTNSELIPEIVFGVNAGILTVLISLQLAVRRAQRRVNAHAKYWAAISERLIDYIESEFFHREDVKTQLEIARKNANPDELELLIYA